MSSGPFTDSFYEAEDGEVYRMRVQPETLTVNGGNGTGPATGEGYFSATPSRRRLGRFARGLRLVRTAGTGVDQYRRYNFLPVNTEAAYDAFNVGGTLEYNNFTWTISAKIDERVK